MTPEERAAEVDFFTTNHDPSFQRALRAAWIMGWNAANDDEQPNTLARVEQVCRDWIAGFEKSAVAAGKDAESEFDTERKRLLIERQMRESTKADVLTWLIRSIAAMKTKL